MGFRLAFVTSMMIGSALVGMPCFGGAIPHLDPQMTGAEYSRILARMPMPAALDGEAPRGLDLILQVGQRNLDWLKFINQSRPESAKLSFSSPENEVAYPVESPKIYNESIIQERYKRLLSRLPRAMKEVLIEGKAFTSNPVIDEKQYLILGLELDGTYQAAARWRLLSPYRDELTERARDDIRGYYYFLKEENLKSQLQDWKGLEGKKKKLFRAWLLSMCINNNLSDCAKQTDARLKAGEGVAFYGQLEPESRGIFESFFKIPTSRRDVTWDEQNHLMQVPFMHTSEVFEKFLKENIEEEWKLEPWHLLLAFVEGVNPSYTPHLAFEPGATPHVNTIAGNEITMDQNAPLSEYDVRWTIRHEYGHVLGFPDCYHEFYDVNKGEMINYQLDTTDLMCSRRGHLKQRHYDELKRVYGSSSRSLALDR